MTFFTSDLMSKRVSLLQQLVPRATRIAFLEEKGSLSLPRNETRNEVLTAASALGWQVDVMYAGTEGDLDAAFGAMTERRAAALVVAASGLFSSLSDMIVTLAARYKIPAIYQRRADTVAGGLMSYGTDIPEAWRRGATIVGKILKGAKPADLPIERSTKFDFVISSAPPVSVPQSRNIRASTQVILASDRGRSWKRFDIIGQRHRRRRPQRQ